ncbi:anti-sigma factor [Marinimicrobium agarilyticum]|uniref:anti-sigma factor n=1 Tax=Marinimicrobium agarilyticum TaxID=306546 RepID=UPI000410EBCC|nr:anti-sigma factor [Marinimicrobium agarilyticum]
MNYLTQERRNALAAEYALGTLQGPARVRFQQLMMEHRALRKTVWHWERGLNGLGEALPEQSLRPEVWERIKSRLGMEGRNDGSGNTSDNIVPISSGASRQPSRSWQWLAGLSTAAAIILAVLLVWQPGGITEPESAQQLAVVQNEEAEPLWFIEVVESAIRVRATSQLDPRANRDYELWLVAADGRDPVSLGLLPKRGTGELPRSDLLDQVEVAALAVSLEPLGGSPTGQPTTVLYTAKPVTL